ncbi:MAG: SHOCT domain-containing protein [Rikenellaceae bacterium]|nr:SHOCT domain-containing protein [Rikenellaceae bacterium]
MKIASIIGIVFFSLMLLAGLGIEEEVSSVIEDLGTLGKLASLLDAGSELSDFTESVEGMYGLGFLSNCYGLILSIIGVATAPKKRKPLHNMSQRLMELYQLKEKGILSSEEFEAQKSEIMADN